MDDFFMETIKTLASDIDATWKFKREFCNYNELSSKNVTPNNYFDSSKKPLSSLSKEACSILYDTSSISSTERLRKTAPVWFQPLFTRNQVEDILQSFEIGVFIVRMNSENKNIVLSYKSKDKVAHIKIKVDDKKGFLIDGSTKVFKNIHNLLSHYFINPILDPDLKLKLPRILMESTHTGHFKFFENMKSDFWFTQISRLRLSEVFLESLMDFNSETKVKRNEFCESSLSLPGLQMREKREETGFQTKIAFKECNKYNFNIFKKLKSRLFKLSKSSSKLSDTNSDSRRKSVPQFSGSLSRTKEFKYASGLANDFDDYDYDE